MVTYTIGLCERSKWLKEFIYCHLKLWSSQEYVIVLLNKVFWRGKGNETYIEDLGKQQQTFAWFHGAAPAVEEPKNNTLQDENREQLLEIHHNVYWCWFIRVRSFFLFFPKPKPFLTSSAFGKQPRFLSFSGISFPQSCLASLSVL